MSECIEWPGNRNVEGYGRITIRGVQHRVHRLVFWMYNGYYPPEVRHKCDNPGCCNIDHLLGGTHADNMRDMAERNRVTSLGTANGNVKLTEDNVRDIRRRMKEGEPGTALSREYGVTTAAIYDIRNRKRWGHIL